MEPAEEQAHRAEDSLSTQPMSDASWKRVALEAPLAEGSKSVVHLSGREILVCRVGDEYFAISNRCSHAAWPLEHEPLEGFEIVCTLHGARFDLRDGCPTAGPSSKPLATHPIELRDGELYLSI